MKRCGCRAVDERDLASGCACDHPGIAGSVPIAAGLADLPRQRAGFAEYRDHMLSGVRSKPALTGWRAREAADLGLMLVDSWAYVLDVTGFYDARIAEESYLRTAEDRSSLRRLTTLTGYRPRPAVAATVHLAAFAEGNDPVTLPAGTGFRSKAVGGEPSQLFELAKETVIDPARNSWTQAPQRSSHFAGIFALAPGAPGLVAGQVAVIRSTGGEGPAGHATRVTSVTSQRLPDGTAYRVAQFESQPALKDVAIDTIEILTFGQSATPTLFELAQEFLKEGVGSSSPWSVVVPDWQATSISLGSASPTNSFAGAVAKNDELTSGNASSATDKPAPRPDQVLLDSIYSTIRRNDLVVVEDEKCGLTAASVSSVALADVVVSDRKGEVTTKVTRVTLSAVAPGGAAVARVHFRTVDAGRLINPAETAFAPVELEGEVELQPPVRLPPEPRAAAVLIAKGQGEAGARFTGRLAGDPQAHGEASIEDAAVEAADAEQLIAPVTWHGNVLKATRGETVWNEVIGSGNSSVAYQTFRLRKKPLTYLPAAASPSGVAPELEVRVNGLLWRRVETLFAAGPSERVYVVRHDDDGETDITFGDLTRPSTGNGNIVATYRYGAGAASPPPGGINQIAKRTPGLLKVLSPMRPSGGADAESIADIRRAAPVKTMMMGRAVSVADYRSFAATFPGVVNAAAAWTWDARFQRAAVKVWIISDGGSVAGALAVHLRSIGDGLDQLAVTEASDLGATLAVDIDVAPDFHRSAVVEAVQAGLTDAPGLFAPARVRIGEPIYRSAIVAAVMAVEGVGSVRAVRINGAAAAAVINVPEGSYLAFDGVEIG